MIENMFHSAALKLTLWYLGIIMVLSICFSLIVYNTSSHELLQRDDRINSHFDDNGPPSDFQTWDQLRLDDLNTGLRHVKNNLVLFNVVVLISGGILSYYLARRSLLPIENALEAQKRFTGDASHELRTPLTIIQTENEVALRNPKLSRAGAIELLESNLEEVAKLKALSDGLLRLSNFDKDIKMKPLQIKNVVQGAIDRWAKAAQSKDININSDISNFKLHGDHESLVELVSILLDNAIKYSPAGSQIQVKAHKTDKSSIISVSDQGEGIKATDMPHIFERFYRSDQSRSKEQRPGYGLGLAIAHKIVQLHSGHINVESTVGKGSVFTVTLPSV